MSFQKGLLMRGDSLPSGWIDLSIGEATSTFRALRPYLSRSEDYDVLVDRYPPTRGYDPLVNMLEARHRAPVVICAGAKQGIHACLMAIRETKGRKSVHTQNPYWISMPRLIRDCGLGWTHYGMPEQEWGRSDVYLMVSPNNPDGKVLSEGGIDALREGNGVDVSIIHDAAYHTPTYLPDGHEWIKPIGDLQIFSFGKMYGLTGLRIGYIVCHDHDMLIPVMEQMERICCGVSMMSQDMLLSVEIELQIDNRRQLFEAASKASLEASRRILATIPESVLGPNQADCGMFGWCKAGPLWSEENLKVKAIAGEYFGVPGMVRLNLAAGVSRIEELVSRAKGIEVK